MKSHSLHGLIVFASAGAWTVCITAMTGEFTDEKLF